MAQEIEITLPAVELADHECETEFGRLRVPGHHIPERRVRVDPETIDRLIKAARVAAGNAHAPYSNFHVGAAALMGDDPEARIHAGANVENSSYGATVCGERSALFSAVSNGFRELKYLALSTVDSLGGPLAERSPCGICRQVIKEFTTSDLASDETLIFVDSGEDGVLCDVMDIERLLPHGFDFSK